MLPWKRLPGLVGRMCAIQPRRQRLKYASTLSGMLSRRITCGQVAMTVSTAKSASTIRRSLDSLPISPTRTVPRARRKVMESNQVHLCAAAVARDTQQILHVLESRLACQIVSHVLAGDPFNRVDDDVAVVHLVTAADLDARTGPDTNAA